MNNLLNIIKQASVDAVSSSNPVYIFFGVVKSISPIEIIVEQKISLKQKQLIFCSKVKNELINGDKVLLIRMQGGQQFIVIDKVVV